MTPSPLFIRQADGMYYQADPSLPLDLYQPRDIRDLILRIKATRPPHFVAVSGMALAALQDELPQASTIAKELGMDARGLRRGQLWNTDVFLFAYDPHAADGDNGSGGSPHLPHSTALSISPRKE